MHYYATVDNLPLRVNRFAPNLAKTPIGLLSSGMRFRTTPKGNQYNITIKEGP